MAEWVKSCMQNTLLKHALLKKRTEIQNYQNITKISIYSTSIKTKQKRVTSILVLFWLHLAAILKTEATDDEINTSLIHDAGNYTSLDRYCTKTKKTIHVSHTFHLTETSINPLCIQPPVLVTACMRGKKNANFSNCSSNCKTVHTYTHKDTTLNLNTFITNQPCNTHTSLKWTKHPAHFPAKTFLHTDIFLFIYLGYKLINFLKLGPRVGTLPVAIYTWNEEKYTCPVKAKDSTQCAKVIGLTLAAVGPCTAVRGPAAADVCPSAFVHWDKSICVKARMVLCNENFAFSFTHMDINPVSLDLLKANMYACLFSLGKWALRLLKFK